MELLTELTWKLTGGNFKFISVLKKNFNHVTLAKTINSDVYNATLRTESC